MKTIKLSDQKSERSIPWLKEVQQGIEIFIKVKPNGKKNAITGEYNEMLSITLQAPPVDGKANAEVCKFFSKLLKIPQSRIIIKKGEKSRGKVLLIEQVKLSEIFTKIEEGREK